MHIYPEQDLPDLPCQQKYADFMMNTITGQSSTLVNRIFLADNLCIRFAGVYCTILTVEVLEGERGAYMFYKHLLFIILVHPGRKR
jgi:hypothetical protein